MNTPPTSPYLIYRPNDDPNQYIIPNATPGHRRGRFELAFSQIGGSVITGAALGGTLGAVRTLSAESPSSFAIRRTQLINSIVKGSTNSGNTFGVIALVYSAIGVGLSLLREDDSKNTAAAAIFTGIITLAAFRKRIGFMKGK